MSLLAQYEDLCRYTEILTSLDVDKEFKIFVENQLNCLRKRKKTDEEVKKLSDRITYLEIKNECLEAKIKRLKKRNDDANSTARKVKWEKKCLEKTIAAVKDIILTDGAIGEQFKEQLTFLNSSIESSVDSAAHLETIKESVESASSLTNVSQTNDHLRNYMRLSNYQSIPSMRESSPEAGNLLIKSKLCETEAKLNVEMDHQHDRESVSSSSDTLTVSQQDFDQLKNDNDHKYDTNSISDRTQTSKQFLLNYFNNSHQLVPKTVLKPLKCLACGQNIGCLKQSLKCQSCAITCHPECKNMCPKICFPIANTPIKGTVGNVADYAPSTPPMIPPLVFHCVKEIESRGMKEIGLYRVPASERDVRNVINKFVSDRIIPCLSYIDTHTLCAAIKEFLRSLNEPLISSTHWQAFVDAANLKNTTESLFTLFGLVQNLPQPNRDTLSFLILHWQNVAESPDCKMDAENLSSALGPIVLGSLIPESASENISAEAINQYDVMKRLFTIPISSWENILGFQMCRRGIDEETPENVSTIRKKQLLGPIYVQKV